MVVKWGIKFIWVLGCNVVVLEVKFFESNLIWERFFRLVFWIGIVFKGYFLFLNWINDVFLIFIFKVLGFIYLGLEFGFIYVNYKLLYIYIKMYIIFLLK